MTSWLQVPRGKRGETKDRPLFYQITGPTYTTDFIGYVYAKMYADKFEKPLHVYDKTSQLPITNGIIENTFEKGFNVVYEDHVLPSSILLSGQQNRVLEFLLSVPATNIHDAAAELWRWNPAMIKTIEANIKTFALEGPFDIGIHLTKEVFASTYVSAIKKLSGAIGESPSIFIHADSPDLIDAFKRRIPKTWKITHAPVPIELKRIPSQAALQAYHNLMTGLYILQSAPIILSALSNPTGKFLYLTSKDSFKSLDTNTYTFF